MKEKILDECLNRMKNLGLNNRMVIEKFKKGQRVLVSEYMDKNYKAVLCNVDGYTMAPGLKQAIKDFEKKHESTVYHVIATPFKEWNSRLGVYTYSLLYVKHNDLEWFIDNRDIEKRKQVLAYVIGTDDEFGYIGVGTWCGGIYRTW